MTVSSKIRQYFTFVALNCSQISIERIFNTIPLHVRCTSNHFNVKINKRKKIKLHTNDLHYIRYFNFNPLRLFIFFTIHWTLKCQEEISFCKLKILHVKEHFDQVPFRLCARLCVCVCVYVKSDVCLSMEEKKEN